MKQVAERAGVSISTVSHVVNKSPDARIGDDARGRVEAAVEELGYRPNPIAKNLVKGRSNLIGLVSDSIATTPFAGQIVHGAQDEAWKRGFVLLIANTEGNAEVEAQAIAMMRAYNVRGILYSTWNHRGTLLPEGLADVDRVLVNCFAEGEPAPAVVPDELGGGLEAARMLLKAGHRRLAFINTTSPSPAREGRLAGLHAALREAGAEETDLLVLDARPEQEGGYAAAPAVVRWGATGVFCHNDRVAMGLYDALRERGLRIPEQVSIVGFDNQEVIAGHLRPPLSTVALPHYELGVRGIRALLGLETVPSTGILTVPCPPVLRESVAPPGASAPPRTAA